MPFTNFPDGVTSFGIPLIPGIPVPFPGNYIWAYQGSSYPSVVGGSGTKDSPFNTLDAALDAARDGKNDVILFEGTMRVAETLAWSKNKVHLIGLDAPTMRGKRSRITTTGSTLFTPMVNVTGEGCYFGNFATFYGFATASAQVLWNEGGDRNCYDLVEFLGFGTDEAAAQANSRGLVISKASGNKGEHTFRNCVFGTDTIARTAANYTLEIANGSPRNYFYGCHFEGYFTGSGADGGHLLIGSGGIDRYLKFENCQFHSSTASGGSSALTQAFNVHASAGGYVICKDDWFTGCTNVETSASGNVFMTNAVVDTADAGLTVANAPS
jgi:hypothetical protein